MKYVIAILLGLTLASTFAAPSAWGGEWSVPLAGNAFRGQSKSGNNSFSENGNLRLSDSHSVYNVYFHLDRPTKISIDTKGLAVSGNPSIEVSVGDENLTTRFQGESPRRYSLGEVNVSAAGYVRVELQRIETDSAAVAELSELIITTSAADAKLDCVKSNEGNMFYWGRRGPSVHLGFQLPQALKLTHAYNEVTVPEGKDPIGSYFMANGFSEGYFGIQVNSSSERRVLFSVWSPFKTDTPAEIPDEDRIVTLAKGKKVKAQDFGNEGSGGQSFLVYPWKAGVTYRFLTEVLPDGKGNTRYTSWFSQKDANEWRLVASFQRPKTDKYLTGFHSFLENFSPDYGDIERSAQYGNQWVCDTRGEWHEITSAKFTGDATARGRHRLDYAGGIVESVFFLRNCGFFSDQVSLDQVFRRDSAAAQKPQVNFDNLPRR